MKKILALLLICLFVSKGASTAFAESDALTIAVATDMHYLSPQLVEGGELIQEVALNGDGKMMHLSGEIVDAFLREMEAAKPDYLILSGDLTLNGGSQSHKEFAEKLRQLEKSGISVLVIPGNHDVDGEYAVIYKDSGAEKAPALSSDEFMKLYADFGPDLSVSGDGQTFSYSVDTGAGLRIIMLDANCYGKGFIKEPTLLWLEEELQAAKAAGDRVITVSHQNLYAHNRLLSFGYQLYNGKALQPLLEEYGVLCNLSGHIHTQSIVEDTVPEIATSSLCVAPAQYGVIEFAGDALSYRTQETDVAGWAENLGYEDSRLLDFAAYGEKFFMDNCRRQVAEMFAGSELSAGEIGLLQESFARLNLDYFAGRQTELEDIAEGLELWSKQERGFMQMYIETMSAVEKDSWVCVIAMAEGK